MNYGFCQRCYVDKEITYCKGPDAWLCWECEEIEQQEYEDSIEEDD